jgi:uncharacterized membrane protein YkvA (DUF1232 family)
MTQFDAVITDMARRIGAANREPLEALRRQLRPVLPEQVLTPSLTALTYYIEHAPTTLRDFAIAASASGSASLQQVAAGLYQYLLEPNDLLPDTANGVLGFLDDAWLIHNTVYRCIAAQLLNAGQFATDWSAIVMADALALQLFPPEVARALEEILSGYSTRVAAEMRQFQVAPAGEASSGGKTIDDYYYTIGGTAYLSTRPTS